MKVSIILGVVGTVALAGAYLLEGPQLLCEAEAVSIAGGECNDHSASTCQDAGDCEGLNLASHFFNDCSSGSGLCVRCTNGPDRIEGCQSDPGSGKACGPHATLTQDCGVEYYGLCNASGDCIKNTEDPEKPCIDAVKCCETSE